MQTLKPYSTPSPEPLHSVGICIVSQILNLNPEPLTPPSPSRQADAGLVILFSAVGLALSRALSANIRVPRRLLVPFSDFGKSYLLASGGVYESWTFGPIQV